jgi:hypothetical protein
MMSALTFNGSLDTFPIQARTCLCCGKRFPFSTGTVYGEEGGELALYAAELLEHGGVRRMGLLIGLLVTDQQGRELEKDFVSLVLWKHDGKVVTSVVTEDDDPVGRVMTKEEALASPFLSFVFEIDDFIVANDPYIAPFLEEDGEGHSQEDLPPAGGAAKV